MMYIQKVHAQPALYRRHSYKIPETHPHQHANPIPQQPMGTQTELKNNLEVAPFTYLSALKLNLSFQLSIHLHFDLTNLLILIFLITIY